MKSQRLSQMEQYIQQRDTVPMEALCEVFGVSMPTVRRDIAELIGNGTVRKVYGGVRAQRTSPTLAPFDVRAATRLEEKKRIARRAAELVEEGDVIYIDSGTTTMHMVKPLRGKHITLVTNSLEVIEAAAPYPEMTLLVLPGTLQRRTKSLTGLDTLKSLKGYHMRWAFMAATGLSMHGVTNSSPLEYEIKRAAMAQCEQRALLVDAGKFGLTALLTYAALEDFSLILTGEAPAPEYQRALKKSDTQWIIAP